MAGTRGAAVIDPAATDGGGRHSAGARQRVIAIWLLAIGLVALQIMGGPVASAAGVSVTDGTRTLTASQAQGLDPDGTTVTVSGRGYDMAKGIYLAVCVDNGPDAMPTPCLGGVDMSGASGGSVWISSNPPPYGEGLAKPYGAGGTFTVSLAVVAVDSVNGTDCRITPCAIVTRNDHLRSSDRSQDLRIPISFGAVAPTAKQSSSMASSTSVAPSKPSKSSTSVAPSKPSTSVTSSTSVAPSKSVTSNGSATSSTSAGTSTSVTSSETPPQTRTSSATSVLSRSATGSDGISASGGIVAADTSSPTAPLSTAPTETRQVDPAADSADDSEFPGALVAVLVVAVAVLAAGGLLLYRRRHR